MEISINNGISYTDPETALENYSMALIAHYMDDDAREAVHRELAPCTDLEFLTRYLQVASENLIIG